MATVLGTTALTLVDYAKRMDPKGNVDPAIVELLAQQNPVTEHMPWVEGNLTTGHRTTVRTGLPTPTWRLLNKGVAATKSTTAQIDEACGMLEARCQLDKSIADLGGDRAALRMSESVPHFEAMTQEFVQTLFYGTASAPEEFVGLTPRYSSLSATNGSNIVDGGAASGQTDCSSIWLLTWGENSLHGIYPKGSMAGVHHEDLGLQDAFDASNNRFRAYMDHYKWDCGIALRDWRQCVRIANIDISLLISETSAADLVKLMTKAYHRVQNLKSGKSAYYMNRTVFQYLDIQRGAAVVAGGGISWDNVDGMPRPSFRGIPIYVIDQLTQAESVVA